jgi:chemotaxis protein methyltransferase CheR
MGAFAFNPPVFALFSSLIEERTGIHYEPTDRLLLAGKVEARATAAGFESALHYYYSIRGDAPCPEFDALVDSLVVSESYFFREAEQLTALAESVLRPLCEAGRRPRVWSAGCATGEEPLTLAILLDGMGLLSAVDILASDIAWSALARAKAGDYGERSVRSLPPGVMGRWLARADARVTVTPRLRDSIEWRHVNLVDETSIRALGMFDAILCRNVLIYFSDETIQRVVRTLRAALRESAPLLVGASESLLRFGTDLRWEERAGTFFHVRSS